MSITCAKLNAAKTEISEIDALPVSKELKKRWSYFIRKVYETDSLICPKCQGEMWLDKLTTLTRSINFRVMVREIEP